MVTMRNDLLESYAACSWAKTQPSHLERRIKAWIERPAYLIQEELRPDLGKKLFKIRIDQRRGDMLVNAEVGAIINSLRSSLDLLASALAVRNGKKPSRECHFPIYRSRDEFIKASNVRKREKWLSPRQIAIIELLKPYNGGDDELFALHHLDIARKHERLVRVEMNPYLFAVNQTLRAQGFEWAKPHPGLDDDAIIGWANIDATNSDLRIELEVTLNETGLLPTAPIVETLRRLYGMTDGIIQRFESD